MEQNGSISMTPTLRQQILYLFLRLINPFMKLILRSSLHTLASDNTMLITFTGRKTGKQYTTPVSYIQDDHEIIFVTPRHCLWWRNLYTNRLVTVQVKEKTFIGTAVVTADDQQAIKAGIARILMRVPRDAPYYPVEFDHDGTPNQDQLQNAAESHILVQIQLR